MDDQHVMYAIMAVVMTCGMAFSIFTGRIRYRGWSLIDRDLTPTTFWTHIGAWGIVAVGLVLSAMF
jgi:hypothetical protein